MLYYSCSSISKLRSEQEIYMNMNKNKHLINRKLENLNQYLGRTQPDPAQEQQTKKDTPNL